MFGDKPDDLNNAADQNHIKSSYFAKNKSPT
jgi:hypothetical protein